MNLSPADSQALMDITKWLTAGLAAGGAARVGLEPLRGLQRQISSTPIRFHPRQTREIFIDLKKDEPKKPNNNLDGEKSTEGELEDRLVKYSSVFGDAYSGAADLLEPLTKHLPEYKVPWQGPENPQDPNAEMPWRQLATLMAPLLGGYAGYNIAGSALKGIKKQNEIDEVDNARADYYEALARSIAHNRKLASTSPGYQFLKEAASKFDAYYDKHVEKKATDEGNVVLKNLGRVLFPLNNFGNTGATITGAVGLGAGALGAYNAYQNKRITSLPRILTDEAERLRKEEEENKAVYKTRLPDGTIIKFKNG